MPPPERHMAVLGWTATIGALFMYFSYIDQIRLNLAGQPGSTIQPAATMINCALWFAYGFCRRARDWPIMIANVPGVILGAITLATAL